MAKELPYFKFFPSEYLHGNITLEEFSVQGFFINLCSIYWIRDCRLTVRFVEKRLIKGDEKAQKYYDILKKSKIIKQKREKVIIDFLDEQYKELAQNYIKKVISGHLGAKQRYSTANSDAKANPGNKDKEVTPESMELFMRRKTQELLKKFKLEDEQKKNFIPSPGLKNKPK